MMDLSEYLKRRKQIDEANIKWVEQTLSPERKEEIALALLSHCNEYHERFSYELLNSFNGEANGILTMLEQLGCYCEPGKKVGEIPQEGGYYEEFETSDDKDYLSETGLTMLNRGYVWSEIAKRNLKKEEETRSFQQQQLQLAKEANSTAALAVSKADEANRISREGNTIAMKANDLSIKANTIAGEAKGIADASNILAKDANNLASRNNTLFIISIIVAGVAAIIALIDLFV